MKLPEVEVQCADFDHVFLGDLVGKICGRHVLNKPRLPLGLSRENFTFHGSNECEIQSELRHSTSTLVATATLFLSAHAMHNCPTVHPILAAISFNSGSSRTENR